MTEPTRRTAVAGPISLWLTRVVALAGLAGVVGVGHSLFVPVYLTRQADASAVAADVVDADPADSGDGDANAGPAEPSEDIYPPGYVGLAGGYELFQRAQTGEPVWFLDARRPDEFEQGRIAGAIFMPANRVNSAEGLEDLAFVDPTGTVVIYCVGGDCDASENTAVLLEQLGYSDIVIMKAGYTDWVAAGYPIEP